MTRNQNDENLIVTTPEVIKISNSSFAGNGTNTVTISNVAPATVGTATISKWLAFQDDAGTTYYIPCWT